MSSGRLIDAALVAWFALTALSASYVAYDAFRRNPELTVMKWGWLLVTLYMGPVGAALYVLSCQESQPGTHADIVRPLWKQGLGSTIHCMAGDATGIVVAAAVTTAIGFAMWQDVIAEYVFGFAFGLLIFQALVMRIMLGGSYIAALRRVLLPEWLSMNAVMAGMIPVMIVLMTRDMRAMHASSPRFWGIMSLASMAGFLVAYPVNVWLVAAGLKHGMGTTVVLGAGGHSPDAERVAAGHHGGARTTINASPPMAPTATTNHGRSAGPATSTAPEQTTMPGGATSAQIVAVTGLSLLALAAGLLIAALTGDLTATVRMEMPSARMPASMDMR